MAEMNDWSKINKAIAIKLKELAEIYEKKKDVFRERAYSNAARIVNSYSKEITENTKLKGIGKSILGKILEFKETGEISKLAEIKEKEEESETKEPGEETIDLFMNIHGVGKVKAKEWYDLGYRTLEDLKNVKMTNAQTLGYKYYYDLQERIPRCEMHEYNEIFMNISKELNVELVVAGSFRRGVETSGDIDVVIKEDERVDLNLIVEELKNIIIGTLAKGKIKYMGIVKLGDEYKARRLDLLVINKESWPYALLYFTGSQNLNILMRDKAKERNWTLNEHGLFDNDNNTLVDPNIKTEKDIFNVLDMKYIPPVNRSF